MDQKLKALVRHLSIVPDPRRGNHYHFRHRLIDIIVVAVLAVIAGADSWIDIADYGNEKKEWLTTFLSLESGIPSHDTFARVFALLNTEAFETAFVAWVASQKKRRGDIIALDGKSARRSFVSGGRSLHMVNAYATEAGIALGQRTVDGKSNEITAVPELLSMLNLKGCTITADALNTQKEIVKKAREYKANYVLALKGNHARLFHDVRALCADASVKRDTTTELHTHAHGRSELRVCDLITTLDGIRDRARWEDLHSVIRVTETRTVGEKTTTRSRYYISSLTTGAQDALRITRAHWKIENSLHWVLDIAFREDESRARIGNSQKNFSLLRKFALNIIRADTTRKVGVAAVRKMAGWNNEHLERLIGLQKV